MIYLGDCVEGMKELEDGSVNLVCVSPPYNLWDISVHKKIEYNTYKDNKDYKDYINWLKEVFEIVYAKLTDDGRCVINVGDLCNGRIPTHYHITNFMLDIGYNYYTTIIWNKGQTSRRTAWGSWLSPSCISFPTPFEYILVFHKGSRKLLHKGETDLEKQEFIDWSLAIWTFPGETRMKKLGHPAAYPIELPKRVIKMFSYIGDVVMDPFGGIFTTALAAKKLNRKYISYEIDEKYYEIGKARLNE